MLIINEKYKRKTKDEIFRKSKLKIKKINKKQKNIKSIFFIF